MVHVCVGTAACRGTANFGPCAPQEKISLIRCQCRHLLTEKKRPTQVESVAVGSPRKFDNMYVCVGTGSHSPEPTDPLVVALGLSAVSVLLIDLAEDGEQLF